MAKNEPARAWQMSSSGTCDLPKVVMRLGRPLPGYKPRYFKFIRDWLAKTGEKIMCLDDIPGSSKYIVFIHGGTVYAIPTKIKAEGVHCAADKLYLSEPTKEACAIMIFAHACGAEITKWPTGDDLPTRRIISTVFDGGRFALKKGRVLIILDP